MELSNQDSQLIKSLHTELVQNGALEDRSPRTGMRTTSEEVQEMLSEAAAASETEEQMNPTYWRPEVEEPLFGLDTEENQNPMLRDGHRRVDRD